MDKLIVVSASTTALSMALIAVSLPRSNVSMDPSIVRNFGTLLVALLALYAFSRFAVHRARDDKSRFGRAFVATFGAVRSLSLYLAVIIPAVVATGVLSYFAAAAGGPLIDADLLAFDAMIGFDWLAVVTWLNGMPVVPDVLQFAYHSFYWQVLALPVILIATSEPRRLLEFAALIAVTAFATSALSALMPAIGPYAYLDPEPDVYSAFDQTVRSWHWADFHALRSGEPFFLKTGTGLVSFPSFHTIIAILITFAVRGSLYTLIPFAVVNGLLIVGTIPVGGHYLVDVIAGAAIAGGAIASRCYLHRLLSDDNRSHAYGA